MTRHLDRQFDRLFKWLNDYGGYTVADVMQDSEGFYIMVDYETEGGGSDPKKVRVPKEFEVCL